jgi:hypothetical protein
MKILVDDFTIYGDMESHLMKFRLCFQKCRKYIIIFNLEKCAFMVFSRLILRFIVSKEGKILDSKKVQAIRNMPVPTNPQHIHVFNGMARFYRCFIQELCLYHGTNHKAYEEDKTLYLDHKVSKSLGSDQVEIHGSTDFDTSKLAIGISCAHRCIIIGSRCNVGT